MKNIDIIDALNQLAAISVADLEELLRSAGPLRVRALVVAANLRKAVLHEDAPS